MYNNESRDFEGARRVEQFLCNCVKNGDVDALPELLKFGDDSEGLFSSSTLGKSRTQFVITVSLISRAAVDGGLPIEITFALSDIYLLRFEQLTDSEQIFRFLTNSIWL